MWPGVWRWVTWLVLLAAHLILSVSLSQLGEGLRDITLSHCTGGVPELWDL